MGVFICGLPGTLIDITDRAFGSYRTRRESYMSSEMIINKKEEDK
jgi:hypothetical protein